MSFEFYTDFPVRNIQSISAIAANQKLSWPARIALLAQAISLGDKEKLEAQEVLRQFVHEERLYDIRISNMLSLMEALNVLRPRISMKVMPDFTFIIEFDFRLAKPYISRDDSTFYIVENPVRKDKVFKVPLISSSSWKGNLRYALRLARGLEDDSNQMISLFGNEREAKADFRVGRLYFYPTFFQQIDLEVITPLDRETKTPESGPILIECVPENAEGNFSLLYVPVDLIGKPNLASEVQRDLRATLAAIREMMLVYGFSAKKSSGFGVIKPEVDGQLWTNVKEIAPLKWEDSAEGFLFKFSSLDALLKDLETPEP